MYSQKDGRAEKLGRGVGYAFSYFLFTSVLFLVLEFTGRIPASWSYPHVMGITVLISVAGAALRRYLG